MSALSRYDRARTALAEAHRLDEVQEIINQTEAVLEYARRAKDVEMVAHATGIRQDAARKASRLLDEMKAKGERASAGDHVERSNTGDTTLPPTLADLGITRTQASRWRKLAALTDDEFEARKADVIRHAVASIEQTCEERQAEKREQRREREVELSARQLALPDQRFGVILADPPWRFEVYSNISGMDRAADNHYPTAELDAIKALDVASIAAPDSVLFLWATAPMLPEALEVMAAWGFAYRTHAIWIKDRIGTGYWLRNRHEILLLGTRGDIPAPAAGEQFASALEARVGEHSAKPDIFFDLIERYFPTLPKIELNRRGPPRIGWTAWGNEVEQPKATEAAE